MERLNPSILRLPKIRGPSRARICLEMSSRARAYLSRKPGIADIVTASVSSLSALGDGYAYSASDCLHGSLCKTVC